MKLIKNDSNWRNSLQRDLKQGKQRLMFPPDANTLMSKCEAVNCVNNNNKTCILDSIQLDATGKCSLFVAA